MKSILLKSSLLAISLAGSGTGMGIVFSTAVGTLLKLISSYVVTTLGPLGDVVTGQSLQLLYFTYDWHSFVFVTIICPLIVLTIILWFWKPFEMRKRFENFMDDFLLVMDQLYTQNIMEVTKNVVPSLTPAHHVFLKSIFMVLIISSIDLLLWLAATNLYTALATLTFLVYIGIKATFHRLTKKAPFWSLEQLDEVIFFARLISIVGAAVSNHSIALLFRFLIELFWIYTTSFMLKNDWHLLVKEYNQRFSELSKYNMFRILQVDKTVLLSLLFWGYYNNPLSRLIHIAVPVSIGLLLLGIFSDEYGLRDAPLSFQITLIIAALILTPAFDITLMQITLNVKKVVKSPTKTGLEIFSELYTSAAYRPLIGNQPGGAATQELVKTIGKWALVTSAPVLIHKIATHMSDERHAEKTLQRNHRNLDRLEQNNKAIPEEIRAKVINHTMNPTPSGSKPGLLGNLFGWGKK